MTSDPIKLFEQMFTIIGHDETESKTLAKDLYGTIVQKAILFMFPNLSDELKRNIESLVAQGKQYENVWTYLSSHVDIKILEQALTSQSFLTVKEFIKTIEQSLTKEQKEKLYTLFAQQI